MERRMASVPLEELDQMDKALAQIPFGDLEALAAVLPQRAELLAKVTAAATSEEEEHALRRSRHAGAAAIRQICLTRNLIMQEMSQLTQEQRWQDAASNHPERCNWSLQG